MTFFKVIIVFLLALVLFLAMSVGVAFCLVWIFPPISFEIGVLIGTVSVSMIIYVFIKLTSAFSIRDDNSIDNYIIDKVYDEVDLDQLIPPKSTRSRRKRR